MKLKILEGSFIVCRLAPTEALPLWIDTKSFWSAIKTQDELSIVCKEIELPESIKTEKGWRIIQVEGPLDFGLTGILASIANPLAAAKVSIFALSTFDTDYILVKAEMLALAQETLKKNGFSF